jgi:hypothetical protein
MAMAVVVAVFILITAIPVTAVMRHGVDNEKHRPVGNPKRKV